MCLDQPKLPEDHLYSGTVFHGKADVYPLGSKVGDAGVVLPDLPTN